MKINAIIVLKHIFCSSTLLQILTLLGLNDWREILLSNKFPMAILSYALAMSFLFLALHVTRSIDFNVFTLVLVSLIFWQFNFLSFLSICVYMFFDFSFVFIRRECGSSEFFKHMKNQLVFRIQSELPGKRIRCNRKGCRCRSNCIRCRSENNRRRR